MDDSLKRLVLALAFLGAVFVGFTARLFVSDTPLGQTFVFIAFGVALYPVARTVWFASVPQWRYWAGLAFGSVIAWSIDTWRRASLSSTTSDLVGIGVVALLTMALVASQWWVHRKRVSTRHG